MKKEVSVLKSAISVFALIGIVVLAGCGGGGKPRAFVGQWVHYEGKWRWFDSVNKIELFKDGTGIVAGTATSWKVENRRFVLLSPSFAQSYNYNLSGSELTFINDDNDSTIYVKKGSAKSFIVEGNKAWNTGNADSAISLFSEAIKLDSKLSEAYRYRAKIYKIEKHDYDQAIADFSKAIKLNPSDKAYNERAETYIAMEDYDNAIADYTQVIQLTPDEDESEKYNAYETRAGLYVKKGDYDKAIADYTEVIRIRPDDVNGYIVRAGVYLSKLKDYDNAIDDYTYVIQMRPGFAGAYNNLCWAYGNKGEYDKAIEVCNQGIRLNSRNANLYHSRGFAYLGKKDYDSAIDDFAKALRLDPNHNDAKVDIDKAGRAKAGL